VTVNTSNAFLYADNTFASTNHSLTTTGFTAIARDSYGRRDTNTVSNFSDSVFVSYDDDGRMVNDGRLGFQYDEENQLIAVWDDVVSSWKSEFVYDGKMRRRIRKEFTWTGSAWKLTNEVRYVYDGNLVIQERDSLNAPVVTYTRGNDLSGSFEGAGGIGGLLARTDERARSTAFYHADRLGNVTMLINAQQLPVAKYLYDPFGNTLSSSGPLADANLYRFSSKELHANSALTYYLYRYYSSALQHWINRDPLDSQVGTVNLSSDRGELLPDTVNLYRFVENNPTSNFDADGRYVTPVCTMILVGTVVVEVCVVGYICHRIYQETQMEKCRKDCDDKAEAGEQECREKRTRKAKAKCWRELYDRLAGCLQECNEKYPEKK
jgi:RHS repeat-associated protein